MSDQVDAAVWDPDPLKVGDRVRVRLSGECQRVMSHSQHPWPHSEKWNGMEGEITFAQGESSPGHPYWVSARDANGAWQATCCARTELERLP